MLDEKKVATCKFCPKAPYCLNRDTEKAEKDHHTCFKAEDDFICEFCPRAARCVNKGTKIAKHDRSCFEKTVCSLCESQFFCQNPQKNRKPINLSTWKVDEDGLPECFISPINCEDCPVAASGQCKNRGLSKQCEFDSSDPSKPKCFSGQHSVR